MVFAGYASPIGLLAVEYSWGIHRVFMGYSYVSVMYRLCVGYVTEHTSSEEAYLSIMKTI